MTLDPIQVRILNILKDWYPITVEELKDELALPSGVLERALKALMVKGIIELEPLTDKTFIRLLAPELALEVEVEKRGHKKTVKKRPGKEKERNFDIMYS